ncbi:hypothetical protein QQP08_016288 [Theobroma cacao]|nr:hypothetical protein QQP08_016288 [Theobroma cacao]
MSLAVISEKRFKASVTSWSLQRLSIIVLLVTIPDNLIKQDHCFAYIRFNTQPIDEGVKCSSIRAGTGTKHVIEESQGIIYFAKQVLGFLGTGKRAREKLGLERIKENRRRKRKVQPLIIALIFTAKLQIKTKQRQRECGHSQLQLQKNYCQRLKILDLNWEVILPPAA